MIRRCRLRSFLGGALLLAALLPVAGVGLMARRILEDRLTAQAEAGQAALAGSVAGEADRFLEAPRQLLTALASSDASVPLEPFVRAFPSIDRLLTLDGRGRVLSSVPGGLDLVGLDFSRQPFFASALPASAQSPDGALWSSPALDAKTGEYFVTLSLPRGRGRIVAFLSLRPIEALARRGAGSGADAPELLILDASGIVVARSVPEEGLARESRRTFPPIRAALQGRTGIFRYADGGLLYSGATAIVPGSRWIVLVRRPLDRIRAPIDVAARAIGTGAALAALLALGAAWLILRRVSRSLGVLEARMGAIAEGSLTPRKGADRAPFAEFDAVLRTFDGMAERIRSREAALAESESRYALVVRSADEGLWDWDLRTGRAYFSDRLFEILGRPRTEVSPTLEVWREWTHPEDWDEVVVVLEGLLAGHVSRYEQTYRMLRPDGETVWVRSRGVAVFDGNGPSRVAGSLEDVTARKAAEEAEHLAAGVFENAQEGILITDPEGTILSVNPAMVRMSGYGPEELIGRNPRLLKSGVHDRAFYERMWGALLTEGRWQGEIYNRRKDGAVYPEWLTLTAVRDGVGRVLRFIGITRDLTERKRYEERIAHEANHDALTGLPNRRKFLSRLEEDLGRIAGTGRRLGVLFMDLDGFKGVNDTLGHDVGDLLLVEVARRLSSRIRLSDLVARMGGDEFTFVLEPLRDPEDLRRIAEAIRSIFESPFDLAGRPIRITGSLGGAVFPDHAPDLQGLLKAADLAMYRTKERGRDGFTLASDPA